MALHALVGMALEAERNYSEARKEYSTFAAQDPVSSDLRMIHLMAVSGWPAQARQLAERLGKTKAGDGLDFAATYGALGDFDKAFEWRRAPAKNARAGCRRCIHSSILCAATGATRDF